MLEPSLPSLLVLAAGTLALLAAGVVLWLSRRSARPRPLPADWALSARPVFNADERRLHRLLREALPQHVVLAKLPLVRLCQPTESQDVRYWFDLLGAIYVGFAICSASGRVLAAIDLDERGSSRRTLQIKQAVLRACHIRYLRCTSDELPSIAELQMLVPQAGYAGRGAAAQAGGPAGAYGSPGSGLADDPELVEPPAAPRRARRPLLWQDSGFLNDSFFGADSRAQASYPSAYGPYSTSAPQPRHPGGRRPERGERRYRDEPVDRPDDGRPGRDDDPYDPFDPTHAPPARRTSRPMPLDHDLWPGEFDERAELPFDVDRDDPRPPRRAPLREHPRPGATNSR